MYLKSLILKGFKSFADRSVLNLEPGITAIVGPNGSGKSNISDAVLWVLGERSARNLRGQAMEDIIFAGSAARKAVSVAEVDLVLDNSDHTLPVEFDEVVITRKMYRTGESEYLVNGVVSRRLDVLEILHDTGLGTGTHSIISQGSLDSILQSKPEDRRALIEEAAGVLKHKQRKEKSARKLATMDAHLARVRDVAAEIARQLGPLERKAKRAQAYQEVSAELAQLTLALAVDDLRNLQQQWDALCEREKAIAEDVTRRKEMVAAAEQRMSDVQELLKRESDDASELSQRQRRASSLAERLDSAEMLMRERRRAAVAYEADGRTSLEGSAQERMAAVAELEEARASLQTAEMAYQEAQERAQGLANGKGALDESLRKLEASLEELTSEFTRCERESDEAKRDRDILQESLANDLAHMKLIAARKSELGAEIDAARSEEETASQALKQAEERLEGLEASYSEAESASAARFNEREAAQQAYDAARDGLSTAGSEVSALEAAIRAATEEDPAYAWVLDNADTLAPSSVLLSTVLKSEDTLEDLVESLLGSDLAALAVKDRATAKAIADGLKTGRLSGDVSLIIADHVPSQGAPARAHGKGQPLIDRLTYPDSIASAVEALLGDIVLMDSREEVFEAAHSHDGQLRFASRDGIVSYPDGRVRIYGTRSEDARDGMLARERKLDQAKQAVGRAQDALAEREEALHRAESQLREAQSKALSLSQQLAAHRGACEAARAEQERAAKRLAAVQAEAQDIEGQMSLAQSSVDELRPRMDEADGLIATLGDRRAEIRSKREELIEQRAPLREQAQQKAEALAEAKLAAATNLERKAYAERIVTARTQAIDAIDENARETRRQIAMKAMAVERGQGMLEILTMLEQSLARRTRLLDEAATAARQAGENVHADATSARDAARKAHDEYDAINALMSSVQVDKSRMEVQVDAAVNRVVHECGMPLEVAEELPQLENRQYIEDESFRLERRIRNMGTINPDAAEEYAALKERYDFIDGQLSDMEAARRSLNRIVNIIDARMKDDFIDTFKKVDENFNEVFSLLFPGGTAHLSLVDPDDIENSGVEVTAQPRGKRLTKMMLMSGGEKSLTALALLFAVYKTRATPFYILDEVEAALDDTNLRRLMAYIDNLRETTQLIMITHQRRTMEMADVLFGVSMQADGVTKVISQKLDRALENAQEG